MRSNILSTILAPVSSLPALSNRMEPLIEQACGSDIVDLLWHLPTGAIDRNFFPKVNEAPPGRIASFIIRVINHEKPRNRKMPYKIKCDNEDGELTLVFFHSHPDYLRQQLPEGELRLVSGRVDHYRGKVQINHPDYISPIVNKTNLPPLEPVYPLTEGLTRKVLSKNIQNALKLAPDLPEWIDLELLNKNQWPSWNEALRSLHQPQDFQDLAPDSKARQRLAFDELLADQLAVALIRKNKVQSNGRTSGSNGKLYHTAIKNLPFHLTTTQEKCLKEIMHDMKETKRMVRLLHGDVGSGKTVIAFLAMVSTVAMGYQATLMVPTEILAQQHYDTINPWCERLGIKCRLLTGSTRSVGRTQALEEIQSGETGIIVGTHAIFQKEVQFCALAFAVIDEQHKFGVHQRLSLSEKGTNVDLLVLSATPIPRTLLMTAYGDMDVSRLTDKPINRGIIKTLVKPLSQIKSVTDAVARSINQGGKVYWVCPLIEESYAVELSAVTARYKQLKTLFGSKVGMVHGQLESIEKDRIISDFAHGEVDILVATTVIEVGVDVTDATVMVVEQAERFGLSQLHQLRGRVGRGQKSANCILLYGNPLSATARARLDILRQTNDGFLIAEEDLRLRGAGELLGSKQSGLPQFKIAELPLHNDLLVTAHRYAQLALNSDNFLQKPAGPELQILLYLFRRDSALSLLGSG